MNYSKKLLFLTLLTVASLPIVADDNNQNGELIINEFMQSNIDGIMDDLNDFPDSWVELYNSGNTAVNLKDYKIGTKKSYISRIENGRSDVQLSTLFRIFAGLGKRVSVTIL